MRNISGSMIIIGVIALVIFGIFFWLLEVSHITLAKDDLITRILPYILLIGLLTLGSGIGIKVYRWRNS